MSRSGSQVDSLDQFFFCGIIERGADAALDIAERLVDYLQGVEPVPHRLPLQIHQHRVAQSRHQAQGDQLPIPIECTARDVFFLGCQPPS